MPALIAIVLRFLFVAAVQTGAWVVVSQALEKLVDWIRDALKTDGGLTETETDDVLLNEVLDALAMIGVTVASLKTKLPIRLADKLGLKGTLAKKSISSQTKAKVQLATAPKAKLGPLNIKTALGTLFLSFVGSLPWLPGLIQNFGDQATFQPANANNYYESLFGIRPFKEPSTLDSPPPFGKSEFTDYALSLEFSSVVGINDPYKGQSLPYSRTNLAELIFNLYGNNIAQGVKLTPSKMITEVPKYLIIPGKSAPTVSSVASSSRSTPPVQNTKVFIGAIGGGTLTAASAFTPRPDDLIVDMGELETALRNNLSPFLSSALGRFVYETKVVSSITTKDGFTQRGQPQQVISGYTTSGKPQYKTVVNKFAVADVYFLTESGSRAKAGRIVLGPTDAVRFKPTTTDLGKLDLGLKDSLVTSSLSDVSEVKKSGKSTTLEKADAAPVVSKVYKKADADALSRLFRAGASNGNPPPDQLYADTGKRIYILPNLQAAGAGIWEDTDEYVKAHGEGKHYEVTRQRLKERYGIDFDKLPARNPADLEQMALQAGYDTQDLYNPGIGNVKSPIFNAGSIMELVELASGADTSRPVGVGQVCGAESLTQFFTLRGEKLPSVEARSAMYEQYNLGPRGFYTGTAEQNSKLLSKLKGQAGCPV